MKTVVVALALFSLIVTGASAQEGFQDGLLNRLEGSWIMEGTIAGNEIVHDITAEWVLGHHYMRLHEVSREKTEEGGPAYEAIVFIGWDEPSGRYVCLCLDLTGGGGLTGDGLGYAERGGDDIPFVFKDPTNGDMIYNTFSYSRDTDIWKWLIDLKDEEGRRVFARVSLKRK